MVHGVRKGVRRGVRCPVGKGMCFTTWGKAEAERVRLGAERAYLCTACGYYHITRYTDGEYSQRMADTGDEGCTFDLNRGMVVLTDDEGVQDEQPGEGGEPPAGSGDAGEASQPRGGSPRLAPSPATVARRLQARRDS